MITFFSSASSNIRGSPASLWKREDLMRVLEAASNFLLQLGLLLQLLAALHPTHCWMGETGWLGWSYSSNCPHSELPPPQWSVDCFFGNLPAPPSSSQYLGHFLLSLAAGKRNFLLWMIWAAGAGAGGGEEVWRSRWSSSHQKAWTEQISSCPSLLYPTCHKASGSSKSFAALRKLTKTSPMLRWPAQRGGPPQPMKG